MKKSALTGLALFFFMSSASAIDVGVGFKAGTVGLGVDLSASVTKTVNLRLSLTSIDIEDQNETLEVGDDVNTGEVDAELSLDYGASALFVDWYIFGGTFHLTAGAFKNNGKAELVGVLQDDLVIEGQQVDVSDLVGGEVSGSVSLGESVQPYLGIGWGRKAGSEPGLSITVDLGVALLDPKVELEAQLSGASTNFVDQQELNQTLRDFEKDAEDELSDFELFPIASIGINYAF